MVKLFKHKQRPMVMSPADLATNSSASKTPVTGGSYGEIPTTLAKKPPKQTFSSPPPMPQHMSNANTKKRLLQFVNLKI